MWISPKLKHSALGALAVGLLFTAMAALSCTQRGPATNSGNANAAQSAQNSNALPANATPLGRAAPGYFQAGPTGDVALRFTSPQDNQTIADTSIAPTLSISGYPIYQDEQRKKGQHIHVILDNEPYEADYDPNKPFSPENAKFNNLKEGTHTLRAFPSREWHESIKEPGAFGFVVFHVKRPSPNVKIDKNAPLLTYSRPKGEYRWKEDPRGVILDFYVTNATLGPNDYKVKVTTDRQKSVILARWEPVWWKWEEIGPGEHTVLLELLDKDNKPVPFKVGNLDYNRTERKFKILNEGEKPSTP